MQTLEIEIKINSELQGLIPPLSKDEFSQLEKNCLADGIREPLIIAVYPNEHGEEQRYLADGHNRYRLSQIHKLSFSTEDKYFDSLDDVKVWMIDNQKGRRNLSDFVKYELESVRKDILAKKGREKILEGAKIGAAITNNRPLSTIDKGRNQEPHDTRQEIATTLGWSTGKVAMADKINKTADEETKKKLRTGEASINKVYQDIRAKEKAEALEQKRAEIAENLQRKIEIKPIIKHQSYEEFLAEFSDNSIDLLLTDPPYSTDIDDIETFVNDWLPMALQKLKPTGRAYICTGAYPQEVWAYLKALLWQSKYIIDSPLIWTYRNTLGVTPKMKYNLNYQIVWHLYSPDSAPLDTSITNEMFSVQDINAPDGRHGNRWHTWQKPDELGERLIRHSTQKGDLVVDCFACTGTFLLMAAKLGRIGIGCDISSENLSLAEKRGCDVR